MEAENLMDFSENSKPSSKRVESVLADNKLDDHVVGQNLHRETTSRPIGLEEGVGGSSITEGIDLRNGYAAGSSKHDAPKKGRWKLAQPHYVIELIRYPHPLNLFLQ